MRQKILNQVGSLLIGSILITFLVVALAMYQKFGGYMAQSLKEEAKYIGAAIEKTDGAYLLDQTAGFSGNTRITLIAEDGTVLYDSMEEAEGLVNHSDRPEVQEAMEQGEGEEVRFSETLSKQTFYYALRLSDGKILRMSRSMDSVIAFLQSSITLMGILVFGIIIVAFFVVRSQTARLIEPINKMDLEHPLRHVEYEELRPLLRRVHEQNKQIQNQMQELKEAEQMRREFSANVSHELKSPLMSISGYAELIENGMARQEDIPEFAGRIHQEANRLTNLVQDIIQLSKLEGGTLEMEREAVDLYALAREAADNLKETAQKRKVSVTVEGQEAVIDGIRQILYEMIYNLVDNAIKYNKEDGWVRVTVEKQKDAIRVKVRDSGIGIAKEEQDRVYERFYRVDKSHSRQTGGTGLGLSIVKHGAILHDASIVTESQLGYGTTIMLEFHV